MKIAILGFAGQGQSSYQYWNTPDNTITICDANANITMPNGVDAQLGEGYLENLDRFDLIIRTPVLHPRQIAAANPQSPNILQKVWSNTNEFMQACPSHNIIGVTGTKGKGTTSTLITRMLEAAGKTVHLGGNIGTPPLDLLQNDIKPTDWVVLELANFQLIDLRSSPPLAVCLMVVPEHMDWHADMAEYVTAKRQLFVHQKSDDVAIFYPDNQHSVAITSVSAGQKIPYMKSPGAEVKDDGIVIGDVTICHTSELKLLGKHNWQNVCAAATTAWQITQDTESIRSVLTSFSGLEHRLELVATINDVQYYDDSFGTTPETAIVALEAFSAPKIAILGGSDKGASFDSLAQAVVDNNVRHVVVIGDTANAIKAALVARSYNQIFSGGDAMVDIVRAAQEHSQPGDIVLLSTGCASFGLFKNYKDRGEQFKKAVLGLA